MSVYDPQVGNVPLPAPNGVVASDGTYSDKVSISWGSVSGASYYRLYRSTSSTGTKIALSNWQISQSYNDTTAISGTTYYYWVKAATSSLGANASAYSSYNTGWRKTSTDYPDEWDPGDNTVYGAPILVVSSYNKTHGSHGLAENDEYDCFLFSLTAGRSYTFESTGSDDTFGELYNVNDFTNSTQEVSDDDSGEGFNFKVTYTPISSGNYYLRARHYTTGNDATYTLNYSYEIPALPAPGTPTASDGTYTDKVRIDWGSVSGATHYRVYRATSESGTKTTLGSWQSSSYYYDTSAVLGTTYYYWVKAAISSSGANASEYSNNNSGYLKNAEPSAQVSNVSAMQVEGSKEVIISYDIASDDNQPVSVSVEIKNGTTIIPAVSLTGNIGDGVAVGTGKTIVWNMGVDWKGNVAQGIQIIVTAIAEGGGGSTSPEMVAIPAGTNAGTDPDFGIYSLTVDAFKMDKFEVTNDEMVRVMQWAYDNGKLTMSSTSAKNASGDQQELLNLDDSDCRVTWSGSTFGMKSTKGSGYPCVEITWYGAVAYCNYRSEMEGKTACYNLSTWNVNTRANGYRLPTSDEWEYTARGGLSGKRFPWGDTLTHSQANYQSSISYSYDTSSTRGYHPNYDDGEHPHTSPSGTFAQNGYGVFDMAGNVWEWCCTVSGSGWSLLGGSWYTYADNLRCGNGSWNYPDRSDSNIGFRAICSEDDGPEMVSIPAGTNAGTDPAYGSYSLTVDAFEMDKFEVTNDEMVRVMQWAYDNGKLTMSSISAKNASGDQHELLNLDASECRVTWNGSAFGMKSTKGSSYPCVEVTWYGAAAYCNYRSEMEEKTPCYNLNVWSVNTSANGYRLPTSDEWEYAARGGLNGKRFPWGDTINHGNANYCAEGSSFSFDTSPYTSRTYHPDYEDGERPYTSPTGVFAPNGYGLFDMAGNVWEWCDIAEGLNKGGIRGGSYGRLANIVLCGLEFLFPFYGSTDDVGFRVVSRQESHVFLQKTNLME